jgi:4-hydroxy-tetrahydrodipicolinate reductase
MNFLVLGKGKMGSLIIERSQQRGHKVRAHDEFDNVHGSMLTPERLKDIDVVIDFTTPDVVLVNVEACARAGKSLVVGTTGWYDQLPRIRQLVEETGIGFIYAANYSIGVNIFMEAARTAATALKMGYSGHITECHHIHKKDAPSGTAIKLQKAVEEVGGKKSEISSIREGEVFGVHTIVFDSVNDSITLTHDAKSRGGLVEGAVRAAEWLSGKKGFYEFERMWRELI